MLVQDLWCLESFYWLKCKITFWRDAIFAFPAGKMLRKGDLEQEQIGTNWNKLDGKLYMHNGYKCGLVKYVFILNVAQCVCELHMQFFHASSCVYVALQ